MGEGLFIKTSITNPFIPKGTGSFRKKDYCLVQMVHCPGLFLKETGNFFVKNFPNLELKKYNIIPLFDILLVVVFPLNNRFLILATICFVYSINYCQKFPNSFQCLLPLKSVWSNILFFLYLSQIKSSL